MKHLKALIFMAAISAGIFSQAQIRYMGANFDFQKYQSAPLANFSALGFGSEIPSSYSLEKYAPYAGDQGQYGTCVGWSSSYGAMTIAWAKYMNETDRDRITASSFDPYFTYEQIKSDGDYSCLMGSNIYDALTLFKNRGCKLYYLQSGDCGYMPDDLSLNMAKTYRIKSFNRLFDYPEDFDYDNYWEEFFSVYIDKVTPVKQALANGSPVIIGTYLPNSIFYVEEGQAYYEPTAEEKADWISAVTDDQGNVNGHAMVVIGYDDNYQGGAFRIMNSWGPYFADNGFFWISYETFNKICSDAWSFELFGDYLSETGCVTGDCDNGYGIYRWDNGDMYEGMFKDGVFDGYGIYKWSDGYSYAGQWRNGQRHGYAVTIDNGTVASGYWDNDIPVSYYVSNERSNTGCIEGDCENGFGTFVYENGRYTGTFHNGARDGYGTYLFDDGTQLECTWSNGSKEGIGKITFPGGQNMIVEFNNDYANGVGLVYSAGGYYTGFWIDGEYYETDEGLGFGGSSRELVQDAGALKSRSGMKLVPMGTPGDVNCVSGDCSNGYGTVEYDNGSYTGYFRDGMRHGYGVYSWNNGLRYEGSWDHGLQDGMGKITWPSGEYFFGEFRRGRQDGYGLEVHPDYVVAGIWEMDVYQPGKMVLGFGEDEGTAVIKDVNLQQAGIDPVKEKVRIKIAASEVQTRQ